MKVIANTLKIVNYQEFTTALNSNKTIFFIKDIKFTIPAELPNEWKKYTSYFHQSKTLNYSAQMLDQCVAVIKEELRKLRLIK